VVKNTSRRDAWGAKKKRTSFLGEPCGMFAQELAFC